MVEKQWNICPSSPRATDLVHSLDLHPVVAQLLVNRGCSSPGEAEVFLYPSWDCVPGPYRLKDMEAAVSRVNQALTGGETVCIYGDYDVDGQTSTALLVRFLRSLARDPHRIQYYIPHRMEEGYGLNRHAVDALSAKTDLLITVDCGIVSVDEAELAADHGMDVIITDHHEPEMELPRAAAVINPHQAECGYPFKGLAGVGVAFQLVRALADYWGVCCQSYLDLVALGTTADLVPLVEENRFFVHEGLKQLASTANVGLRALVEVCALQEPYQAADFGYRLGPRLNAVGRMGAPERGVRLLLTEDEVEAGQLAAELDHENQERREVQRKIVNEAVNKVEENGWQDDPVLVVAGEEWHSGVIGIVASRLVETYYKPTVVIALDGEGEGKASARSISGFHLFRALQNCRAHLLQFGGHEMAAGLSIAKDSIDGFRRTLAEEAQSQLAPGDYIPQVMVDSLLSLDDVDESFVRQLHRIEPCGVGNPAPVLQLDAGVAEYRRVGNDQTHAKMLLKDHSQQSMEAIAFSMGDQIEETSYSHDWMHFLVEPQINEWKNRRTLQLQIHDLQPANRGRTCVERWMAAYPWRLESKYRALSPAADSGPSNESSTSCLGSAVMLDLRGMWNKTEWMMENLASETPCWIVVHTAEEALHICRDLRIAYPGRPNHIGFFHGFLSEADQADIIAALREGGLAWIAAPASAQPLPHIPWRTVVHWYPPLNSGYIPSLCTSTVQTIAVLYGKDDKARLQTQVQMSYPERRQLAVLYGAMAKQGAALNWSQLQITAQQLSLEMGLPFALKVFAQLNLVEYDEQVIKLLPKPKKKLDLNSSVLYNGGMEKRRQYLDYLRYCLERGLFHEFEGHHTGHTRLP